MLASEVNAKGFEKSGKFCAGIWAMACKSTRCACVASSVQTNLFLGDRR